MTGKAPNGCDSILNIINKLWENISIMNALVFCQIVCLIHVLERWLTSNEFSLKETEETFERLLSWFHDKHLF